MRLQDVYLSVGGLILLHSADVQATGNSHGCGLMSPEGSTQFM